MPGVSNPSGDMESDRAPGSGLRIGIIGDGNVGTALQAGWKGSGYEVQSTGKDPQRVKEIGEWADVIVLAVPWKVHEDVLRELGDVQGKVLVDVSNALGDDMSYAETEGSLAERLQGYADGASIVKAFNTVFAQNMTNGQVGGEALTAFIASDDDGSKAIVNELAETLGFDAVDAGPLENAKWLETLGYLNIQLGYKVGLGADIGFRLVQGSKVKEHGAARSQRGERPAPKPAGEEHEKRQATRQAT